MSWHLRRVPTAATLPTKLKSQLESSADSDESSSLLLYRGGCDHDQATFVRSAIFYKSELPIVLLQHQNDIMQT